MIFLPDTNVFSRYLRDRAEDARLLDRLEHALPDCAPFHGEAGRQDFFGYAFDEAGNNTADMTELIEQAHARNLRVFMDIVPNHTSSEHAWFQELLASRLNLGRARGELDPVMQRALTVAAGGLIGAVVTISSVGAGVIGMMILLILYPKHAPIRIVGSDLAHAVLITAIAGAGHARMGSVNYELLGWLLLGALPGIWIGSRLGFGMDPRTLKRAIAGILIVVGSMTLWKTLNTPAPVIAASQAR